MKSRKGSALVMTLLIFIVLMIFGTFILGFMITENKQSLHYQHKTEAYYLARSGAVTVEAAIMEAYEKENDLLDELISMDNESSKNVKVSYEDKEIPVDIKKKGDSFEIVSQALVRETKDTVTKILEIKAGETVDIDEIFTVMSPKDDPKNHIPNEDNKNAKKLYELIKDNIEFGADKNKYKLFDFDTILDDFKSAIELPGGTKYGEEGKVTNYVVDEHFTIDKEIKIVGTVNIFVKGGFKVTIAGDGKKKTPSSLNNDNKPNEKDDFNIYILPDSNIDVERLKIDLKGQNEYGNKVNANVYVGSGKTDIKLHSSDLNMNITSNGKVVNLTAQTGNTDHAALNGNIYAPEALVNMSLNAVTLNGFVVSNYLRLYKQNVKNFPDEDDEKFKKEDYPKEGKLNFEYDKNQELEKYGKPKISSSYFK